MKTPAYNFRLVNNNKRIYLCLSDLLNFLVECRDLNEGQAKVDIQDLIDQLQKLI